MPEPVQPGWRPDPQRPGTLRWWNGLGWSDARRPAGGSTTGTFGVRPAAEGGGRIDLAADAVRQNAVVPASVTRAGERVRTAVPDGPSVPLATAARAVGAANAPAAAAVVLGVLGVTVGAFGLLPLAGLIVSLVALVRSRRRARAGERTTGFGQSIAGLLLSVVGLVRWVPVVVEAVSSIRID